ncbi:hypothetical protein [Cesiribacter sp. SM1]|uniref:hypothetical protein n=1 Tax=Cesiribacter sp. SM1 TaxID=2861196 RepID=UPI001CD4B8F7|nr:hypothetical protein [Cesiribacter sp. SM1]
MKKTKIAIFHYQPIEYYPPVLNLTEVFAAREGVTISLFTCKSYLNEVYKEPSQRVNIVRSAYPSAHKSSLHRLFAYGRLMASWLVQLVKLKPDAIIYYEILSAPAVWLYLQFLRVPLHIHYHEYLEPSFLKRVSFLSKVCFLFDRALHKKAVSISHTNARRVALFAQDFPSIDRKKLLELPNFPPLHWRVAANGEMVSSSASTLKIVYVGSSLVPGNTFLIPLLEWVKQHPELELAIYDSRPNQATVEIIRQLHSKRITLISNGVPYHQLPEVLSQYHVGVIMYKAVNKNYIHNAPNKLFEYLICNLQVIFAEEMEGIYPYILPEYRDKIIPVDFTTQLNVALVKRLQQGREHDAQAEPVYTREGVYSLLLNRLLSW